MNFDGAIKPELADLLLAFSASIHWMFAEFNIWLLSAAANQPVALRSPFEQ